MAYLQRWLPRLNVKTSAKEAVDNFGSFWKAARRKSDDRHARLYACGGITMVVCVDTLSPNNRANLMNYGERSNLSKLPPGRLDGKTCITLKRVGCAFHYAPIRAFAIESTACVLSRSLSDSSVFLPKREGGSALTRDVFIRPSRAAF